MRRAGWALFAATGALVVVQALLIGMSPYQLLSFEVLVDATFPLVPIGALLGAGVGALIISRDPRNRVGWLLCLGQLGNAIGLTAGTYATLVLEGQPKGTTASAIAAYVAVVFDTTYVMTFLALLFMIAPDGRLPSPRWRYAPVVPVVAFVLYAAVVALVPADTFGGAAWEPNPVIIVLLITSGVAVVVAVLLGATALVLRLRRARGDELLQLRWIATSAAVFAVVFFVYAVVDYFLEPVPWPIRVALYLAYIGVSIGVGVAILKYRLYDIDIILNRAIVLGILVIFTTIGYIAVVVAIGLLPGQVGGGGIWPSLIATTLVAILFQPLRRHVLRLADRLVYGDRAEPYEALADLSRRLADSPTPDELTHRVAEAAGTAVGAAHIRVELGALDTDPVAAPACWPQRDVPPHPVAATTLLPVLDGGEQVGAITVLMPPGQSLRQRDQDLLTHFAEQAGLAFRNALLQADQAANIRELEERSADLAESRRRLLLVEDEERARLAQDIQARVVPHLTLTVTCLRPPPDPGDPALPALLDRLITHVETALDELRTVVHGLFPALLQRRGLAPALVSHLETTHPRAVLDIDGIDGRLDYPIEAASYLFCVQVIPPDQPCHIRITADADRLRITITWNADPRHAPHPDWQRAIDRVEAANGTVTIKDTDTSHDAQYVVRADIPLQTLTPRIAVGHRGDP
jgi:signal transduction histidine kinase